MCRAAFRPLVGNIKICADSFGGLKATLQLLAGGVAQGLSESGTAHGLAMAELVRPADQNP
jgi:hypothetical protein